MGSEGEVGSMYEGYTLSGGDDFQSLDIIGPAAPRGKHLTTRTYGAGARGSDTALSTMFDTDPLFVGHNDSNRGVPVGYSNLAVSNSILAIQARKATAGEQTHMQSLRNEVAGMVSTAGSFVWFADASGTGDIIIEARIKTPLNPPDGWHPTFWLQSWSPTIAFESDEFDHEGTADGFYFKKNFWTAGSAVGSTSGTVVPHDNTWRTITLVINKTNVRRFVDGVLNGTLGSGNAKDKLQYILLTNHIFNGTFEGNTYSQAEWNADADGATLEVDWYRIWRRTGTQHYAPLVSVADRTVDYGSSLTFALPAAADIWGDGTVSEYLQVLPTEENEPGGSHTVTYQQFPTGVSYNAGTREVTVNITSGPTGRLNFALGAWKAGATCEPLRFAVNVGPNPVVPALDTLSAGQVTSIDVYAQQDCGVLVTNGAAKTKTISITGLTGSGLSYSDTTGLLTGTAVAGTYSVGITVTNSVGQSKTVSADKTIASNFNPATEAKVIEWWNADDGATVFSDAAATTPATVDVSAVQAWVGKKLSANLANSTAAQTPEYLTDANGRKSVKFVTANNDFLFSQNATVVGEVSGNDNPFTIIAAVKRGTPGVTGMPFTFSSDTTSVNDYIRTSFGSTDNVGFGRNVSNTLTQNQSANSIVTANQWYIVTWVFEGTTVTIRVNGTVVLNAGTLNSPSITVNRFSVGGRYDDQNNVYTASVAFGGAVGELLLLNGITASDGVIGVAETYLAGRWTN